MSHVTVLKGIVIRDVAAIRQAVNELAAKGVNIKLAENQKPRVHGYDQAPTCDFVIKLPGCNYDVGLRKTEDGTYEPVMDTWGNHVGRVLGAACPVPDEYEMRGLHQMGQFGQAYAKFAAMNEAASMGYTIESCTVDENNNVQLLLNA